MQEEHYSLSDVKQEVKELVNERIHNFKLSSIEYSSRLIGASISIVLGIGLAVAAIAFLSLMASSYLALLFESALIGYAAVASFYALAFIVCATVLRTRINLFFTNQMVKLIASHTFRSDEKNNT